MGTPVQEEVRKSTCSLQRKVAHLPHGLTSFAFSALRSPSLRPPPLMMDRSLVLSEITGASTVALQPSCDPSRASGSGLRRPGTAAPPPPQECSASPRDRLRRLLTRLLHRRSC